MVNLPEEALRIIRKAKKDGVKVFDYFPTLEDENKCRNCGDLTWVRVMVAKAGPFSAPPGRGHGVVTYLDDGWYSIESHQFHCPDCHTPDEIQATWWEASGLNQQERGWTWDYAAGKDNKDRAIAAIKSILPSNGLPPSGWYTIHGAYGVGKSGLLKSLVAEGIRRSMPGMYLTSEKVLGMIQATFNSEQTEEQVRAVLQGVQVFCVDEVDRIGSSEWAQSKLMNILDDRYRNIETKCTVMATNRDPSNMPRGMEYLQSRMQSGIRVEMGGVDLRGR